MTHLELLKKLDMQIDYLKQNDGCDIPMDKFHSCLSYVETIRELNKNGFRKENICWLKDCNIAVKNVRDSQK